MPRRLIATVSGLALICAAAPVTAQSYRTHAEIGQFLLDAQTDYPTLCQRYNLGNSYQGRELWAVCISDNVGVEEDEPEFKYISTMHGNEIVGNEMCLYLVEHLLANYGSDPDITNLVDEIEIWIVPLMNPDGYEDSPRTRYSAEGYDLNRNFPEGSGSSPDPNDPTGRATETQVIMYWSFAHSFTLSANIHTGSLVANYPFDNDGMGSVFSPTPDEDMFVFISEEYSQHNSPMWNSPSFYHGITNGAAWYSIDGGMQDWSYRYMGCNEVTLELSDVTSPSASQLPTFWSENRDSMLAYMETCLIGVRGLVTDSQTGAPLAATVTVVGRDHEVYTDPDVGDYHRMLMPATYDLTFEADGYDPHTEYNVVVLAGEATRLDVQLGPAPPVTQDVDVQAEAGVPIDIELLGYDPNNDPLDFIVTSLAAHGSLSDPNGGSIDSVPYTLTAQGDLVTYTADEYIGTDGFDFKANDGGTPPTGGDSNVSTVNITVIAGPPTITTTELPVGSTNVAYGPEQLGVSGGQAPLVWTLNTNGAYAESDLGTSQFAAVGVAQGWQDDEDEWPYTLPFTFPFYDGSQTSLTVCPNGMIFFDSFMGSKYSNTTNLLRVNKMIGPVWDDLRTDRTGGDIYIDESVAGQVTIRWSAETYSGNHPVNVSLTLADNGTITFHYGSDNTGLTPTIGLSNGDGVHYTLASYDGAASLTNADSLEFSIPGSLPMGMTLNGDGQLGGTPTESGVFHPTFVVTDDLDRFAQRAMWLTVYDGDPPTGDYEPDGDVDLADFAAFQVCFTQSATGGCADAFDFVPNDVFDVHDYAEFVNKLTGP